MNRSHLESLELENFRRMLQLRRPCTDSFDSPTCNANSSPDIQAISGTPSVDCFSTKPAQQSLGQTHKMTPFNPFLVTAGYHHSVQAPIQSSSPLATSTISSRRRVDLDLRKCQNISPSSQKPNPKDSLSKHADAHYLGDQSMQILSENCICRVPVQPPLTPPQDKEAIDWLEHLSEPVTKCSDGDRSASATLSVERSAPPSSTSGHGELSIPGLSQDLSSGESSSPSLWLMGAIRIATQTLNNHLPLSSTKVISHVLPSCGLDQRKVKTYELVCEHLQTILSEPRYISIYHIFALPEGQGVQDIPRSPPATPSFRGGNGYFDAQTMFTHVAQVPLYHEFKSMAAGVRTSQLLQQKNIMPPEANLVVLERYIPPTTAAEIADFFDADSFRSYMADRLAELAVETGSLVLIYPTAKGAKTFARNYIGPVLDPLLRQMVVLRSLGTNAAERLGSMKAISAMMSFEDMNSKVLKLCSALNARSDIQNSRSAFTLSHSETANVVLAKQAWMTWYIDQEQQRLKQDLMEYHKEGGRLPQGESGNIELTAGMLAREMITELQKSATTLQTEAIEVGVFVIRRMQKPFP